MGWASRHIAKRRGGEGVSFRPRGNSMSGKIESGQLCTVRPVDPAALAVGDIVLCKVNGREYLHLIKAIQGPRFQIGNNRGRINGWVSAGAIYGQCVAVQAWIGPTGRWIMRACRIVLGLAGLLFAGDDAKAEWKKMEGTWQLVSAMKDGKETPEEAVKKVRVVIKDGKHSVLFDGK